MAPQPPNTAPIRRAAGGVSRSLGGAYAGADSHAARERWSSSFTVPAASLEARPASPMLRHVGAYYVRLMVVDRPGVIADIAAALRDEQVSMEQMIQRGRAPGEAVPVVLTTHETEEAAMRRALARISALKTVLEPPRMIRVDNL